MRFLPTLLLALLLALASGALAAPPTPSLAPARAQHARAVAALQQVEASRAALDRRHEALATEIEALKAAAERPLLPGVRDPRLDDRLKKARALAEALAALDRSAATARADVDRLRAVLLDQLDGVLATRRAALATAPPDARRGLFEELKALVAEREALVSPTDRAPIAGLPSTASVDEMASPDELRELADESRDHAEQVQSRLSMLDAQLSRLRERQRLVRAATAFGRDDALFAQDERNRQVVRREDGIATATATPGDRPERTPAPDDGEAAAVPEADRSPNPDGDDDSADSPPGFAADDGAEGDPQAGAEGGFEDNDGALAGVVDEPGPQGLPVGAVDEGPVGGGLVVEEAFDPTLLEGLDELSPEALARRIAAIEARQAELRRTRSALESRGQDLERRADALESE